MIPPDPATPSTAASDRSQPLWAVLFWAGMVAALLVSFVHDWSLPLLGTDLRPKRGHLLMEAWSVTKLALAGSLIGGWWWSAACCLRRCSTLALLAWSALGWAGLLSPALFWSGWLLILLPAAVGALRSLPQRWQQTWRFIRQPRPWNAAYCAAWFLLWAGCDAVLLREAPPGALETADALLARLLTHAVITTGVWLLLAFHDRWTPAPGRWLAWTVVVLTPLIVLVNTGLRVWWGKGLMEMFGELEVGGRFELERVWAAGGVELNASTVVGVVGAVLAAAGLFLLCGWISRQRGWRISPWQLALTAATGWTLLQVDQLAGGLWKDRGWRWWERKAFHRRMTWVEPPPGLATYDVQFADPAATIAPPLPAADKDIYFFIVESLRTDTLTPEIAPFLTRWRDEACQPIAESWAASNVTHQSWFSLLSGRLPVYMEEARRRKQMAPLPALLKAMGYRIEVRLVNNFDYMDMVAASFGEPSQADVLEQVGPDHPENFFKLPEREVRALNRLRGSVLTPNRPPLFSLVSLDSPHYNYKWGVRFTPPFADYEENPMFPMRPSPDQVRRIRNRFWNSVAWVDHQLAGFIDWLKQQGRYDDALIIVTGDHGEEFKEHGSWFHGTMLNAPQTRVPILIKWPQNSPHGRGPAVARASHLDLLPTLMDSFGLPAEHWQSLPGRSLLRPFDGPRTLVMSTHFCGRNGEALLLNREGVEAAFGWRDFWTPHVPDKIWLERVEGATPETWRQAFPDVFNRVFREVHPTH